MVLELIGRSSLTFLVQCIVTNVVVIFDALRIDIQLILYFIRTVTWILMIK